MKKIILLVMVTLLQASSLRADHITGGEMYYKLSGISGNVYTYSVTLKLYMRCNSGRNFPNPAIVSTFDKVTGARLSDLNVALTRTEIISITEPDPCISSPPTVCYEVGYFDFVVSLTNGANGYLLASQVNFRIDNISNLNSGAGRVGALYTADIPGNALISDAPTNNSANFVGSDLVIVCANNPFTYSFAATDADNDQLRYSFCGAYQSTGSSLGGQAIAAANPPFPEVPYGGGFNGGAPLTPQVQINRNTGLISGIAPDVGVYVVTVCVEEIRGGKVIATQRKDLQINIANCGITAAKLEKAYMLCDTSMQLNAENLSTSSVVKTYDWQVFNRSMQPLGSFNSPRLQYQFSDTGLYYVKLVINRVDICSDSMTSPVYVYPGFKPDFAFAGLCTNKPTLFTDKSVTRYGVVNGWSWDFGEPLIPDDVSNQKNPSYTYETPGNKNVLLIVRNSVGCIDTLVKILPMSSRPPLQLAFKDTLICLGDTLQLSAASAGTIQWSPATFISNTVGASTKVFPKNTTTYFADLNDNGCLNRDSVNVNVVNSVLLQAMNDTLICATDSLTLRLQSNALQYNWTPAQALPNAQAKQPNVQVNNATTFYVEGVIGGCRAVDSIVVKTVPYPTAYAGADTVVCFNSNGFLHATTNGSSVVWTPSNNLNNATSFDPISSAKQTTTFVLNAYDNKGCPKPGIDSLIVVVLPDIIAFAGRDTNVVVGQPLQLNASGGSKYVWQPATYLSSGVIADPVANFPQPLEKQSYKLLVYDDAGCVDSAAINVKVFAKGTTVYVPTGFTPNSDGKNDVIRPVVVGAIALKFFRVYNRFGQLVFSTNKTGEGWNGKLHGVEQPSGNYVWMVEVLNYDNSVSQMKGTVMLIR